MKTTRIVLLAALLASLPAVSAIAQQEDDLKKEIVALRKDVTELKAEFSKLRGELTKALAAMKTAQRPSKPRQRPAMTMIGKKGPEFSVTTVDGVATKIGGKRDKPQVVFCYASWCGFCKKSLPWIDSLNKKYKDKGVEVIALNLDQRDGKRKKTEDQTLSHYKSMNLSMPMTMTTETNDTAKIGVAYKAQSFPTLFVMGTSGEVEAVHVGAKPDLADVVGKELDVLLAGKNRSAFPK